MNRIRKAIPALKPILLPLILWSAICAIGCIISLIFMRGWVWSDKLMLVAIIYALGAALAFWPSLFVTRLFFTKRSIMRSLMFILFLAIGTLATTSTLFAVQYGLYFSQWHAPVLSELWLWQQFYTSAGAIYIYLVMGIELYLPIAFIGLLITSWWVNRLPD